MALTFDVDITKTLRKADGTVELTVVFDAHQDGVQTAHEEYVYVYGPPGRGSAIGKSAIAKAASGPIQTHAFADLPVAPTPGTSGIDWYAEMERNLKAWRAGGMGAADVARLRKLLTEAEDAIASGGGVTKGADRWPVGYLPADMADPSFLAHVREDMKREIGKASAPTQSAAQIEYERETSRLRAVGDLTRLCRKP